MKKNEKSTKNMILEKINVMIQKVRKYFHKNVIDNQTKYSMREVVFVMVITFLLGTILGGIIMFGRGNFSSDISDSLNEFADTYADILNTYYKQIDADELLQSGIEGMINYLEDPYASFMNKEEALAFNEQVEGEYSGIGAEIIYDHKKKIYTVGKVFDGSPAKKSGLKTGDIYLKINDKKIDDMTISSVADLVKGKTGTYVKITVQREKIEKTYNIKRGKVDIDSVSSKVINKNNKKVGYINISIFAANTYGQFKKNLLSLEEQGIDSLIIDVRGNSGGYLTTVTDIISLFTKKGDIIYQLKTKNKIDKVRDKTKDNRNYPICMLVDSLSASASEVLTISLKENCHALVVGTKTFGKGKVQKAYSLSSGATIKYTFQEWLSPKGNSIDGVGVEPNNFIEYVYNKDKDNQLEEALNEIIK